MAWRWWRKIYLSPNVCARVRCQDRRFGVSESNRKSRIAFFPHFFFFFLFHNFKLWIFSRCSLALFLRRLGTVLLLLQFFRFSLAPTLSTFLASLTLHLSLSTTRAFFPQRTDTHRHTRNALTEFFPLAVELLVLCAFFPLLPRNHHHHRSHGTRTNTSS